MIHEASCLVGRKIDLETEVQMTMLSLYSDLMTMMYRKPGDVNTK